MQSFDGFPAVRSELMRGTILLVLILLGTASCSDAAAQSWCGAGQFSAGSPFEMELLKLLREDLAVSSMMVDEVDSDDFWAVSEYGVFVRARCTVGDWSECCRCMASISYEAPSFCPWSRYARVVFPHCEVEYGFHDRSHMLQEEKLLEYDP